MRRLVGGIGLVLILALTTGATATLPAGIPTCDHWNRWPADAQTAYVVGTITGVAIATGQLEARVDRLPARTRAEVAPLVEATARSLRAPGRIAWLVDEVGLVCRQPSLLPVTLGTAYRRAVERLQGFGTPDPAPPVAPSAPHAGGVHDW